MHSVASDLTITKAIKHLTTHDSALASVIARYKPCDMRPNRNYYQELVDGIISQQLSVQAARAIEGRFRDMFGGTFPSPEAILTGDVESLRSIGFSRAKARYVLDLAQHIVDGKITFDALDTQTNDQIIAELIQVKGIGEWTAHMFLMFCMGRLNVLPIGDLGIRNGVQKLYKLSIIPKPSEVTEIAHQNTWHPYESVASWYVWQSLDNDPGL